MLHEPGGPVTIEAAGKLRSAPGGDARLLAYLERQTRAGFAIDARLNYYLHDAPLSAEGWQEELESPNVHLLAHHAGTVTDYRKRDVTLAVRGAQVAKRDTSGKITTVGGLTAVLDSNVVLAAASPTHSLLAEVVENVSASTRPSAETGRGRACACSR